MHCNLLFHTTFHLGEINIKKKLDNICRCLGTAAPKSKAEEASKENMSFTMNLFRGQLESSQVFPYPDVLSEEQRELLGAIITPTEKFFQVKDNNNNAWIFYIAPFL